jgi:hypothetical protein
VSELYDVVSAALLEAHRDVFYLKDVLLISGQDVSSMPEVLPKRYGRPLHWIDEEQMAHWMDACDSRARYYKWLAVVDWGGDLVVSYFIHL